MTGHEPLVSVVMSAFNAEQFIGDSIASILGQKYRNIELILVDDGSTDRTDLVIKSFADPRIRHIKHARNMRLAASLNEGVRMARGSYVARMDADDVCLPDRIARQVRYMERNPNVTVLGGSAVAIGLGTGRLTYPRRHSAIKAELLFQNSLCHPTVMFRKHAVPEWYNDSVLAGQDYELWVRLVDRVEFFNGRAPVIAYRLHESQTARLMTNQQREVARSARRSLASQLAFDWSDLDWDLFLRGCESLEPLGIEELVAFKGLVAHLRARNKLSRIFSARDLRRAGSGVLARSIALSLARRAVDVNQILAAGLHWQVIIHPRIAAWAMVSRASAQTATS